MSKNVKLMIALSAAVAAGSGATAMLLSGGESWHSMPMASNNYMFNARISGEPQAPFSWEKVMADFNGDGYVDIASISQVTDGYPDENTGWSVLLYEGDGKGNFTLVNEGQPFYRWNIPHPDQDVMMRLAAAGDFNAQAVDINGDGLLDLANEIWYDISTPDDDVSTIWVLYFINDGNNGFTCAGDVTGDGETGVNDILTVIEDWGCTEGDPLN